MEHKIVPDRRVCMEQFSYTRAQRLRIWWRGVLNAISETPPKTDYREVVIDQSDPRWDGAYTYDLIEVSCDLDDLKVGVKDS